MNRAAKVILQMYKQTKSYHIEQLERENKWLRTQLNKALSRLERIEELEGEI